MRQPSEYELAAWRDIQHFKGRPMSQAVGFAGQKAAEGAAKFQNLATDFLEEHPQAGSVVSRGQKGLAKGGQAAKDGVQKAVDGLPDGLVDWGSAALESTRSMIARASRVGLSGKRVVKRHKKLGHEVMKLHDLRHLDLEQIDEVRGRGMGLYYPAIAALSGAGAGLLISGGELVIAITGGAAAAPGGGAVVGAFAGDAAIVLGLSSRSVGHVALYYGYDPEAPGEKLFVMSVVNAGTAVSAGAKTAALSDISRLTQALFRRKAWEELNKSLVAKVSNRFATVFGIRLTKQGLGKVVPAAGIAVGGAFNWATLESIVDTADIAYRRRFLLEKYPDLAEGDFGEFLAEVAPDDSDEVISVLDELTEAGGPQLE